MHQPSHVIVDMYSLSVFVLLFFGIEASLVEFNETQFLELPPLYGLDEWSQCQRPGDVYCMVDAALVADGDSPILTLLKDYSQETLKHYNRTQVHRGLCLTRCAADEDLSLQLAAERCLNHSLLLYNLQAEVLSVGWCNTMSQGEASGGARALAALSILLVAVVFLATILHILGDRCAKVDGNRYLLAFSIKKNWEILTYDRSKPRSDDRMKDLTCIEGIRFIGMQCVIFSHVMLIYIYSYTDNPQFIEKMYDQFGWQIVLNSPVWLQAFFSMSGFLTAYSVLITMEKNPITLFKCAMGVINRWIRLTPAAGVALWFTMSWYEVMGAGPQWGWLVAREAHDCRERWWYHILYLHNHLPMGKFCMGHTWYLAADMQLHVIGLLLLLVLASHRRAALPVLVLLLLGSGLAAGLVTYLYRLTPIATGQAPEVLRTMFAGSQILTLVYLPSWMNLAGYVAGMGTAFILYELQDRGIKLNQNKWFILSFHCALSLGGCVVLSGAVFLSDRPPARWAAALYAALDRPLVALCFNLFMLGCFVNCKSALRGMFEWRGFHVLGRLSYSVFVIHFIVLRLILAGNTQLNHASIYSLMTLLISVSVLSYLLAVPYCLLVEMPAIELWRACTKGETRTARVRPELQPIPPQTVKPLDLVANIRRRQEV